MDITTHQGGLGGGGYGGGLSASLHPQFISWAQQRKPQEENMLEDYEHKMRIVRDNKETTGLSKAQKSRVFIGATRGKIRTAKAKIRDVLFGSGKLPFDSEPTQEPLAGYADTVEDILSYQLRDMKWGHSVGLGIDDLATYGTGFMLGPFARTDTYDIEGDVSMGIPPSQIAFRAPYYERVSPMDCYPDPDSETSQDGIGFFWGSQKQPHFLRALLGRPGYDDGAIRYALTQLSTASTGEGSDRTKESRQNLYRYSQDGRIWFLRYFGLVGVRELAEWRGQGDARGLTGVDPEEMIEAIVIMAGGVVIKADKNPYHLMRRPIHVCNYEEEPGEMWGTGVARNNRDTQNVINGSFRLYLEGKAFALLKMCSIDQSKFLDAEDFKFFGGKKFAMKMNLTPEERKTAIIWHDMVDVTGGWENAIAVCERFSEDDTGITKYTSGTDSDTLNKTATGISMIMNASSLPLKDVISNIDQQWIEPMVSALLQWDLEFLEPATVNSMLGPKAAETWGQIKDYGKTSFITLRATGSSTFLMREVLVQKLTGFMQMALGNPLTAKYIDAREMLQQAWDAIEIGRESPILTDEDMQAMQQQEMQALMQRQGPPPSGEAGAPPGPPPAPPNGELPLAPEETSPVALG